MRFPAETIHRQISEVLGAWGMPADVVRTAADVMTDTDLAGIDSHGISMLMLYEEALGLEQLNPAPVPRVVRESSVTALVDGDAGLGHVAAVFGMEFAIRKAAATWPSPASPSTSAVTGDSRTTRGTGAGLSCSRPSASS